jgi:hypothetical protein
MTFACKRASSAAPFLTVEAPATVPERMAAASLVIRIHRAGDFAPAHPTKFVLTLLPAQFGVKRWEAIV